MLKHRVVTALILVPLVLAAVLLMPTPWLAIVLALIVLAAGNEWTRLAGIHSVPGRVSFLALLLLAMGGVFLLMEMPGFRTSFFGAASLWWIFLTLTLMRFSKATPPEIGHKTKAMLGFVVLVPAWSALVALHGSGENGPLLMLFALVLTWVADTGAYFAGHRWGRVKLAPAISPGKTREGVYGALAGSALWGLLLAMVLPQAGHFLVLVPFAMVLCVVSVSGDLFESVMKRQAGVKDSGSLLPGHGGVLDRIDSLTAVAPVFVFGLGLIGSM
jgi:phosphatidate cytidylyltransferase